MLSLCFGSRPAERPKAGSRPASLLVSFALGPQARP